ncbi:hypothetical protein [Streptomyces sp. NPDC048527]|uniref:hypothetical protein n=1 Tax=Streptomyces sp. NPDC048527 TaxID=3365568 RepID=UPI00371E9A9D
MAPGTTRRLFLGADQPPESQPPTGRLELGARRSEARALAQRLPDELITPRGVLVIEAWGVDDWFSCEDLYGVLHRLDREQAQLFSATSAELEDEYIAAAVEEGTLVTHAEEFASYAEDARHRGRLTDLQRFGSGGHQIRHGRELHDVPRNKDLFLANLSWRRVWRWARARHLQDAAHDGALAAGDRCDGSMRGCARACRAHAVPFTSVVDPDARSSWRAVRPPAGRGPSWVPHRPSSCLSASAVTCSRTETVGTSGENISGYMAARAARWASCQSRSAFS